MTVPVVSSELVPPIIWALLVRGHSDCFLRPPGTHHSKYTAIPPTSLTLSAMLSEEDRAILDFERGSWLQPGPKDQAIEWVLGLSSRDYYERLRVVVSSEAGSSYDPLTAKRVLKLIEQPGEAELAVS